MYKIRLKKKSRTKTNNNSYNILLTKKRINIPIGAYNQETSALILDIDSYILAIKKGCIFSEKFKKIFLKSTGNLTNKQNTKIII
jgi:hypothetical protein